MKANGQISESKSISNDARYFGIFARVASENPFFCSNRLPTGLPTLARVFFTRYMWGGRREGSSLATPTATGRKSELEGSQRQKKTGFYLYCALVFLSLSIEVNLGRSVDFSAIHQCGKCGKMDYQGNAYYTDLLESNFDQEPLMDSPGQGGESSQFAPELISTTKKARRGNFTIEEDILLVSAWLNISLDAVQGNEQKHKAYWRRVWEYFRKHKNFTSDRTQNSLMHRWSTIQTITNKFCGCFASIESRHESGVTEKDKVAQAKIMFAAHYKHSYPFEHCWNELRYQPKWVEDSQKKKTKNIKVTSAGGSSSPATPDSINLGDDSDSTDVNVELERPPGRKAEKDRLNKRKSKDNVSAHTSSPLATILYDLKEQRLKMDEKKMEMYDKTFIQDQQRLAYDQQRLALKQMKEDERIMSLDTSGMPQLQAEYYRKRQMEILGRGFTNVEH